MLVWQSFVLVCRRYDLWLQASNLLIRLILHYDNGIVACGVRDSATAMICGRCRLKMIFHLTV